MDPKEVKTSLKSAREAIKNKEYKEAIKYCKAILKHDKSNYNALVFVAVCAEGLEQADQALAAYKRAIDSSPSQPTAWQGLTAFYEKKTSLSAVEKTDLVLCYEKLLEVFKENHDKVYDIGQKLCQVYIDLNNTVQAVEMYQRLILDLCDAPEERRLTLWRGLANILTEMKNRSDIHETLVINCYDFIVTSKYSNREDLERYGKLYIKLTVSNSDDKLVDLCRLVHEKCSDMTYPLEVLCVQRLDQFVVTGSTGSHTGFDDDAVGKLQGLKPDSGILLLSQAIERLNNKDYITSRNNLIQGLRSSPNVVSGWLLLAQVQHHIHDHAGARQSVEKGFQVLQKKGEFCTINREMMGVKLKQLKMKAILDAKDISSVNEASALLEELTGSPPLLVERMRALVNILRKDHDAARDLCERLLQSEKSTENLIAMAEVHLLVNEIPEALSCLKLAADKDVTNGRALYLLGNVTWDLGSLEDRATCFQYLLKSAKLDPFYYSTFLYLGYFYSKMTKDLEKAVRCYRKSFDLNTNSDEAGTALVDALVELGRHEEATKLLLDVTSRASAGCAKWAWLRLGLQQMREVKYTDSIASLQCAIRADSGDFHCWESLGEAYMLRGSYTAALKVFKRASELDKSAIYPLYQIASIKQLLGSFAEAVEDYKFILEKSKGYVPALKGVGESYLSLANEALLQFFDGKAVSYCEQAMEVLTHAVSLRSNLSCTWKLLGDVCTILHPLSQDKLVNVPAQLMETKCGERKLRQLNKADTLALGARCYGMALKIEAECSSLWHDIAVNYYRQSQWTEETGTASDLCGRSVKALKKALSLDSTNHRHWNALGRVATSGYIADYALAQHCFIKSIQCEANNVWAWTNLGTLYLKNDNIELAHEAYKVAQSLSPKYVACWVGQALIAELVGHEDAMDLFRHTSELSNHVESCIGYAHWVCNTLLDDTKRNTDMFQYCIHQMAALPAATDCIARYLERVTDNPSAFNLHGLLLENQGLHSSACRAFSCAMKLLETKAGNGHLSLLSVVRCNYARSLRQTGFLKEALDQYALMEPMEKLEDVTALALTYFKAGMWKEAYIAYQRTMELCQSETDTAHLTTALGLSAVKYGDIDSAKTHLFGCAQLPLPVAFPGLLALMSLGLLERDVTLSTAALQELAKMEESVMTDDQQADMCILTALLYVLQGSSEDASKHISKVVHKYPWKHQLWTYLAKFLSACRSFQTAMCCILVVRALQLNVSEEVQSLMCLSSVGQSLVSPNAESQHRALLWSQKAVHTYPDSPAGWCCLQASLHNQPQEVSNDRALEGTMKERVMLLTDDKDSSVMSKDMSLMSRMRQWSMQLTPS